MARFLALLPIALFVLPRAAHAQSAPTVRFDLATGVLAGSAQGKGVSAASIAPALQVDFGAQLGEHAAVFARLEGGTIALANEGGAYFLGEWTPHPLLSVGTGIGYEGMSFTWIGGCDRSVGPCVQNSWSGISVPLVLGLNLQPRHAASRGEPDHHGRVRIELEAAGGYDARTETWGMHGFVGVGWTWM